MRSAIEAPAFSTASSLAWSGVFGLLISVAVKFISVVLSLLKFSGPATGAKEHAWAVV